MPLRSYRCTADHNFEDLVMKSDRSDAPTACPYVLGAADPTDLSKGFRRCGAKVIEQLTAPASKFPGAGSWR